MRRLVVCCDGTWNRPDQVRDRVASPTNVTKLALGVAERDAAGIEQVLYYHRGVGTDRRERVRGGAIGLGLSRHVRECYRFLVENYQPDDELYFFGFSRGAFTARSLAGLVGNAGILRAEHVGRVDDAYRLYRHRDDRRKPNGIESQIFRRMYSHDKVGVHFIGVWDTVGALGIPGLRGPLAKRLWGFHDTTLGSHVRFAYHALAIDERRGLFKPTLWEKKTDAPARQKLQQVWFAGVHSDVGGGYRDPSLSEIPLVWMTDRARECGLAFRPDYLTVADDPDRKLRTLATHIAPNPLGELHDSRPRLFRRLPGRRRPVVDRKGLAASAVASSARQRLDEMPDYAAPNLEEYLSGKAPTVVEWSTQQRVAGIERGPRPAEPDAYAA